jgi:hypothetical protein
MAKYYLLPKGLVNRFQWVQTPIWLIEASAFYILLGFARIMPFRLSQCPQAPRGASEHIPCLAAGRQARA